MSKTKGLTRNRTGVARMSYTISVVLIRTGSDNRYTIKPFCDGGISLFPNMLLANLAIVSKRIHPRPNSDYTAMAISGFRRSAKRLRERSTNREISPSV
jgi:hypothetical protein